MIQELAVVGSPHAVGGAGTELLDQIVCWQSMGIVVRLIPTEAGAHNTPELRNCIIHEPNDFAACAGLHTISFCSDVFLKEIAAIKRHARTTVFLNCMCWPFEPEKRALSQGLIDLHLFQTDHQMRLLSTKLAGYSSFRPMRFTPYFHRERFPFKENINKETFWFGRISRSDPAKFSKEQLNVYDRIRSIVPKQAVILGWDAKIESKCGKPKTYIETFRAGAMSSKDFYELVDAIVMTTETFENLPRVGFEAIASGVVLCVDNRGGWRCLVKDGHTGYLCGKANEMIDKASKLSMWRLRENFRDAALKMLEPWALTPAARSWEMVFNKLDSIRRPSV